MHDPREGVLRGWTDTRGLGPSHDGRGVCACEQRPLGRPVLSTLQDAGESGPVLSTLQDAGERVVQIRGGGRTGQQK